MTFSSCLTDQDDVIVLDASVIINLLATGNSQAILKALPFRSLVTDYVVREIRQGVDNGRTESHFLSKLIDDQLLEVVNLHDRSLEYFFDVVSGDTSASLGDGEAATLACAFSNGFVAAIDEKKATRIARTRFPSLKLVTTVDILAYKAVQTDIGHQALVSATLQALQFARLQVWDHQVDWVVQLIGPENSAGCSSLRRHMQHKRNAFNVAV